MEIYTYYIIFAVMLVLFGVFFMYAIIMKWVHFGWKLFIAKWRWGSNTGFLFTRSAGNNFGLPKIMNLGELKKKVGDDTYIYSRNQLLGTTLFGCPYIMFDSEDNKSSIGLYFQESGTTDENGQTIDAEPVFYMDDDGDFITDKHGQKIPYLTQLKPAISMPTSIFQSVLTQEIFKNLKKYLTSMASHYKWIFAIVAGIGVGIGIILYFQYNQQEMLPTVIAACEAARASCGG